MYGSDIKALTEFSQQPWEGRPHNHAHFIRKETEVWHGSSISPVKKKARTGARAATRASLTPESKGMCHVSTEKGAILSGASGTRPVEEHTLVHKTPEATTSRGSLAAVHRLLQLMGKPL